MRKEPKSASYWQNGALIISLYTAGKWGIIAMNYMLHGVVAEGNIFYLFFVIPFGIPIYIAGMVCQFIAILKRRGHQGENGTRWKMLVSITAMIIALVELIYIFSTTS